MTMRRISVSEFKAHFIEEIRALKKGVTILGLTRHGKKVAVVTSAADAATPPGLANWIGSGKGTVRFSPSYDPAAPAWNPE